MKDIVMVSAASSTAAQRLLKILINTAIVLAMATILLGVYTRLVDAGLGCPDWPGCYGSISAPTQVEQLAEAQKKFPGIKIEPHKAHYEMLHRYIAGLLGIMVCMIFAVSQWQKFCRLLTGIILLSVLLQAVLGMWTVSLNLLPLVVLAHLLGGFALLSLLALLRLQMGEALTMESEPKLSPLIPLAWLTLLMLIAQIALGAWTSSNYAALACHQLPVCEPGWRERFSLGAAFSLPLGQATYQYGVLPHDARLSIHVLHRVGALITSIFLGSFCWLAWTRARAKTMRNLALALMGLLGLQLCLGLINVLAYVPLANAVAHNFVAANLLMLLVVFIYGLYQTRERKIIPVLPAYTEIVTSTAKE